jgi:murein DD-endopeptidase MepM/ murein hydrolase activator NlpD
MTGLILTVGVLQLLVPMLLLFWQWRERSPNRIQWLFKTILIVSYLVAIAVAGLWNLLPFFVPYLYLVSSLILAARRFNQLSQLHFRGAENIWTRIEVVSAASFTVVGLTLAIYALSGRHVPDGDRARLAFPLTGGTFYIVSGGGNSLVNAHLETLEGERFRPFRGQSYAVDILQINRYGFRANGFLPSDPAEYAIFGTSVHAPCAGTVIETENDREDMPVPRTDREVMPGNHVLLDCGEFIVLLAHFKKGSVAVTTGQKVEIGTTLGQVGNSGNSEEPHLHIHAQRRGSGPNTLDGEPLWMIFEGEFLVRNQILIR